jgi:predicted ATPase/DNA-binding SARP family transcriptional activator
VVRIGILGPLEVLDGGRPVEVGGQRLRALILRLAVDAPRPVSVGTIADALWADTPPADPANAVQSLVSRLRRLLPATAAIESGPAGYTLRVAPDDVDAVRFERLAAQGRRALAAGRPADAAEALREALVLWRGPALADASDAGYAAAPVARWQELRLACLEDRIEADLQLGRPADVVPELEALVEEHPLRERFRALLVRALAASGRTAEGLAAYEQTRQVLADHLGVDPSPELRDLHVALLRGDAAVVPERSGVAVRPRTNLRAALTSFVGRDDDVERIGGLIRDGRLVTLVGPGGAGKTRLAGEAATRLANGSGAGDLVADGIWLVELAPLGDPQAIATAALGSLDHRVLGVLDQRTAGTGQEPFARLVDTLSGRRAVLLLDNCEHLVAGAAEFAEELLSRCPDLRILATSREPLAIFGEAVYPVRPLGQPALVATPEELLRYPATRLFVERVRAVNPGFELTPETVPPTIEICRRLDGLPLAIELAAARCRSLPVDVVAARLGDRFRLLTGGSRTAVPRHQTLRAVVAWSWDLLSDTERELAERLAVFAGGVAPDSAHGISTDGALEDLTQDDVMDLLAVLADKSLLQPVPGGKLRYRMLETIREFGTERLAERGVIESVRAAHTRYFLELAETAEPFLRGHDQLSWLDRLNEERDNILAALRTAADAGDADAAIRIAAALVWYWSMLGQHTESRPWLRLALSVPGETSRTARVLATAAYAVACWADDDVVAAATTGTELDGLLAGVDLQEHPLLMAITPTLALLRDDAETGFRLVEERLDDAEPWTRAMLLGIKMAMAENLGHNAVLRETLPAAVDAFRATGDRWGTANAVTSLGWLRQLDGDFDGTISALEEATALLEQLKAADDISYTTLRLAMVRALAGDVERARHEADRGRLLAVENGSRGTRAFAEVALAVIELAAGRRREAREHAETGLELMQTMHSAPQMVAMALLCLAHLDTADGNFTTAAERLGQAVERARHARDMPVLATVAVGVADLASARGDVALAAELLGAADAIRGTPDRSNVDAARLEAVARATLGEEGYEAAFGTGRKLDRADAVELVRSQVPEP